MKKHILLLTYEPKIPDVIDGKCAQTIRRTKQTNGGLKNMGVRCDEDL